MSPSKARYRARHDPREVLLAVLGVGAVLGFTGVMLWVLAPEDESTPPAPLPVVSTIPGATTAPGPVPPGSETPPAPTDTTPAPGG